MDDILDRVDSPWMLWLIAAATVFYTIVRQASETWPVIAKALGPLGRRWTASRERRHREANALESLRETLAEQHQELTELKREHHSDAWNADLKRQVEALDKAVTELRRRNQIVDAYLVYDEAWHRTELLSHGTDGYVPTPHKSYLQFEQEWLAAKHDRRSTDRRTSEE